MNSRNLSSQQGALLVHLRHGICRSRRLAERLSLDPLVGTEARGFLTRLDAIGAELDDLDCAWPRFLRPENDPFWIESQSKTHRA